MFNRMRGHVKTIIIVVCVAMIGGFLYVGGTSFFGGGAQQQAAAQAAIASVNGQAISYYEFQQAFINQLQQLEAQQGRVPGGVMETVRYRTLDSLIGSALITQEIANRKISISSKAIDEELATLKGQFESDEAYKQQLALAGLTEKDLRRFIEQDLEVEALRDQVAGDIAISDDAIKAAYEEVRASHILIRPAGTDEAAWEAAKTRAEEALIQVKANDFAEVAKSLSEDWGSAQQGGDIGFVQRGDTVPEFDEAIFNLAVGEISDLVKSDFGYHIIKVTERHEAQGEEFEAIRDDIKKQLRDQEAQQSLIKWFEGIRKDASVVINDNQLVAYEKAAEGSLEDAVHYYELAIADNPADGYLYFSLADVLLKLERVDEATAQLEIAAQKVTNDAELFFQLASVYEKGEKADEATTAYLKASELAPTDLYMQLRVNNALNKLERYEDVRVVEDRIAEIQKMQEEQQKVQAEFERMMEEAQKEKDAKDGQANDEASAEVNQEAQQESQGK